MRISHGGSVAFAQISPSYAGFLDGRVMDMKRERSSLQDNLAKQTGLQLRIEKQPGEVRFAVEKKDLCPLGTDWRRELRRLFCKENPSPML